MHTEKKVSQERIVDSAIEASEKFLSDPLIQADREREQRLPASSMRPRTKTRPHKMQNK